MQKQLNQIEERGTKSAGMVGKAYEKLGTLMTIAFAAAAANALKNLAEIGAAAQETRSLVAVSFGAMTADIVNWSKTATVSLIQTSVETQRQAAMFFNLLTTMGTTREEALKMSKQLVSLAADFSSFFNLPIEEAFDKIRSGLVGETEPLRQLNILIDEQTIKQTALKQGIIETSREMTQAEKVLARYHTIAQQAGVASGDLGRTIDSAANQAKRMKAEYEELRIELGERLVPVYKTLVGAAVGWLRLGGDISTALDTQMKPAFDRHRQEVQRVTDVYLQLGVSIDEARRKAEQFAWGITIPGISGGAGGMFDIDDAFLMQRAAQPGDNTLAKILFDSEYRERLIKWQREQQGRKGRGGANATDLAKQRFIAWQLAGLDMFDITGMAVNLPSGMSGVELPQRPLGEMLDLLYPSQYQQPGISINAYRQGTIFSIPRTTSGLFDDAIVGRRQLAMGGGGGGWRGRIDDYGRAGMFSAISGIMGGGGFREVLSGGLLSFGTSALMSDPILGIGALLLGSIFGRSRQRAPQVTEPIPVKVINFSDMQSALLNITKQGLLGPASRGIDRLESLRLAQNQVGF